MEEKNVRHIAKHKFNCDENSVSQFLCVDSKGQSLGTSSLAILPYNYQLSKSIVHEIKFGDIAVM